MPREDGDEIDSKRLETRFFFVMWKRRREGREDLTRRGEERGECKRSFFCDGRGSEKRCFFSRGKRVEKRSPCDCCRASKALRPSGWMSAMSTPTHAPKHTHTHTTHTHISTHIHTRTHTPTSGQRRAPGSKQQSVGACRAMRLVRDQPTLLERLSSQLQAPVREGADLEAGATRR